MPSLSGLQKVILLSDLLAPNLQCDGTGLITSRIASYSVIHWEGNIVAQHSGKSVHPVSSGLLCQACSS